MSLEFENKLCSLYSVFSLLLQVSLGQVSSPVGNGPVGLVSSAVISHKKKKFFSRQGNMYKAQAPLIPFAPLRYNLPKNMVFPHGFRWMDGYLELQSSGTIKKMHFITHMHCAYKIIKPRLDLQRHFITVYLYFKFKCFSQQIYYARYHMYNNPYDLKLFGGFPQIASELQINMYLISYMGGGDLGDQ